MGYHSQFDRQTATRMEELNVLWDYFNYDETPRRDCSSILGGEICVVYYQENEIEKAFMAITEPSQKFCNLRGQSRSICGSGSRNSHSATP